MDEISKLISKFNDSSQKTQGLFNFGLGMASPVFGMIGNAITQSFDYAYNKEVAERAERRQREAEMNAYAQQMHQQRIADAYNTPSAQMARLREAGLNPMLAFQNGAPGNLSTGVPNAISPQVMDYPSSASPNMEMFSAFTTMADQFNKQRELDIMATRAEFDNAKSDAERQGILKQNSFMDAVENDRHAEANSRILNNAAQRELYFAQKDKLINDALHAVDELFENKRQFDIKMRYLRQTESNKSELARLQREHEEAMQAKQILATEKLEEATNSTWIEATLKNNEYSKFSHFMDSDDSPWKRIGQYEGIQLGRRGLGDAASAIGEMVGNKGVRLMVKRARHVKERLDRLKKNRSDKRDQAHSDKAEDFYRKYEESLKKGDTKSADDYLNRALQEMDDIKSPDFIFK